MKSHYLRDPDRAAKDGVAEPGSLRGGVSPAACDAPPRPARAGGRSPWPVAALVILAASMLLWAVIAGLVNGLSG